jgi:CheY-like chemotaxis protein
MERGRILLVDDDAEIVRSLLPLFEGEFDVVATRTVAAALIALTQGVDVVISDFALPDGDGDELARAVARDGLKTHVILVTGHGDDPRVRALAADGEHLVLIKPVPPEDLLQWVRCGVANVRMRTATGRTARVATT